MLMRLLGLVCAVLLSTPVYAGSKIDLVQSDGSIKPLGGTGSSVNVTQTTTQAGEDVIIDVQKVEQRFAYQNVTGDLSVKSGVGFLHTITCSSDAAATAGTIIVYDNTAESGTIIWTWTISAVEYQPRTLVFDVAFLTGLYVGYTTTADVTCTVSYR